MNGYTLGQYRLPAVQRMAPPPGGTLWCVSTTRANARLLVTALSLKPYAPPGGVEVWDEDQTAIVILQQPQANATTIETMCQTYGTLIKCGQPFDITGHYVSLLHADEVLA